MNVDVEGIVGSWNEWRIQGHYEEMLLNHVLEHESAPLELMEQLYYYATPGCVMRVHVPYGSSDDAWENPHHVRPYFLRSMQAFGQAFWWRDRDANYEADWFVEKRVIKFKKEWWDRNVGGVVTDRWLIDQTEHGRNNVFEMEVWMKAIKPIRVFEKGVKPENETFGNPVVNFEVVEVV